jgi:hypothetical protein
MEQVLNSLRTCSKCGSSTLEERTSCGVCGSIFDTQSVQAAGKSIPTEPAQVPDFLPTGQRRLTTMFGAGITWGLLQAGSFWLPPLLVFFSGHIVGDAWVDPVWYVVLFTPLVIAFLFGYYLVHNWSKIFIISQVVAWFVTAAVINTWYLPDLNTVNANLFVGLATIFFAFLAVFFLISEPIAAALGSYVSRRFGQNRQKRSFRNTL